MIVVSCHGRAHLALRRDTTDLQANSTQEGASLLLFSTPIHVVHDKTPLPRPSPHSHVKERPLLPKLYIMEDRKAVIRSVAPFTLGRAWHRRVRQFVDRGRRPPKRRDLEARSVLGLNVNSRIGWIWRLTLLGFRARPTNRADPQNPSSLTKQEPKKHVELDHCIFAFVLGDLLNSPHNIELVPELAEHLQLSKDQVHILLRLDRRSLTPMADVAN